MKKTNKKRTKNKKVTDYKWIVIVTLAAFLISFSFSLLSETIIPQVSLIVAIIILLFFIALGILFDMIGVAVTVSEEASFHSMAAKKVRGAPLAVLLIRNANKVSSFCNDVIGDICGIMSGATGVSIAVTIASQFHWDLLCVSLFLTAFIASLTIGGKALGKGVAMNKSNEILFRFAKVLTIFYPGN